MFLKRSTLGAVWLFPLATLVLISYWQIGSTPTLSSIGLWPLVFVAAIWLVVARWNRQWATPSAWDWGALGFSVSLAVLGLFLNDVRLTAAAICVQCFVWARNHLERITDRTNQQPLNMLSYLPILIALLGVPTSLWNLVEDWHWSWFSSCAWPVILTLEIPFLISDTGVEFTNAVWSRQAILGDYFSVDVHVAICMLWFGVARRPVLLTPAYAAAALLWAFLTNFLRFVFSAWLITRAGTDCYQGWLVYATGAAALLGSLFLFMATDKLLGVVLSPVMSVESSEKMLNPLIEIWNRYLSIVSNLPAGRQK